MKLLNNFGRVFQIRDRLPCPFGLIVAFFFFFFFPLKCIEVSYLMSHYTTQSSQLRMATD